MTRTSGTVYASCWQGKATIFLVPAQQCFFGQRQSENGLRALELFNPEVDLVILDIMMPGMSGLRVCEELRKNSTVPILFLTAKSQESDKLLGLTAGGDDYLAKPFSFAELSARVGCPDHLPQ